MNMDFFFFWYVCEHCASLICHKKIPKKETKRRQQVNANTHRVNQRETVREEKGIK
jgi:hypothetical protein